MTFLKKSTLAKIPEIRQLHLPAKVIFVSKELRDGGRTAAGWSSGGPSVAGSHDFSSWRRCLLVDLG